MASSAEAIDTIEVESSSISTKNISAPAMHSKEIDYEETGQIAPLQGIPDGSNESTANARVGPGVRNKSDREKKIGHRRVGEAGEITYKKIQTTTIMGSIQLGIQHTVGSLASKPKRDLLMMDFWELETISFPPEGSSMTPAHHYSEFRFKIYAPIAFRYFRDLFDIQPDDFMMSMCSSPLRELSNPGASGSIFYLTDDDEFIIKTVQHKEGEFLQKLLPGYYMNLNQNPRTLLPKFFGLYCYQCNSKNVRLIAMNNLLPSFVKLHQKYDLKGSTYKRKANKAERTKTSPTFKDLDFMEHHPNGIFLEADTHAALIKTIQRDCRVLESFKIMDYSLLVGVHNLDIASKEKQETRNMQARRPLREDESDLEDAPEADQFLAYEKEREEREKGAIALNRSRSINRQRLVAHSTAMESIQAESEPIDEEEDVPPGGIPARSEKGERLLLFVGIIDILQSYRLRKKLEHTWKSIIHDGDTVSVHRPSFYAQRFQDFMAKTVFRKTPSPLKHSPSKRKSLSKAAVPHLQRASEGDNIANTSSSSQQQQHHQHYHHSSSTPHKSSETSPTNSTIPTTITQKMSTNKASDCLSSANNNNNKNNNSKNSINPNNYLINNPDNNMSPINTNANVSPTTTLTTSTNNTATSSPSSTVNQNDTTNLPLLKKKTTVTKQRVPPPVPPRGSPKTSRSNVNSRTSSSSQYSSYDNYSKNGKSTSGNSPSCSSTPPPPFDDILEFGELSHKQNKDEKYAKSNNNQNYMCRDEAISMTEIRLDGHLGVETGNFYDSRGALSWTPPTSSIEGSTPTHTEGTPSYTESSSSGEMDNPSPLHTTFSNRQTPFIEKALNQ